MGGMPRGSAHLSPRKEIKPWRLEMEGREIRLEAFRRRIPIYRWRPGWGCVLASQPGLYSQPPVTPSRPQVCPLPLCDYKCLQKAIDRGVFWPGSPGQKGGYLTGPQKQPRRLLSRAARPGGDKTVVQAGREARGKIRQELPRGLKASIPRRCGLSHSSRKHSMPPSPCQGLWAKERWLFGY